MSVYEKVSVRLYSVLLLLRGGGANIRTFILLGEPTGAVAVSSPIECVADGEHPNHSKSAVRTSSAVGKSCRGLNCAQMGER